MKSISVMRPWATAKPTTAYGRPGRPMTTPARPLTTAGRTGSGRARATASRATAAAPTIGGCASGLSALASDAQHDAGVEDADEGVEVAGPAGGEEGVDDPALFGEVRFGDRLCALDPAAAATCELTGRGRAAPDDRRDLFVGHGEGVVQDEGEPFGRRQRLEHNHQRQPDRLAEEDLLLGSRIVVDGHDRLG
jgi:hypothetical protein